jgi:hypothetical protein
MLVAQEPSKLESVQLQGKCSMHLIRFMDARVSGSPLAPSATQRSRGMLTEPAGSRIERIFLPSDVARLTVKPSGAPITNDEFAFEREKRAFFC